LAIRIDHDCRRVSFILKDTSSTQEGSDPPIRSGSSHKTHRPIRIDCGGATAAATAVAGRINKPLKTGCIGIILPYNSVEIFWKIPQPQSHRYIGSIQPFKALIRCP